MPYRTRHRNVTQVPCSFMFEPERAAFREKVNFLAYHSPFTGNIWMEWDVLSPWGKREFRQHVDIKKEYLEWIIQDLHKNHSLLQIGDVDYYRVDVDGILAGIILNFLISKAYPQTSCLTGKVL